MDTTNIVGSPLNSDSEELCVRSIDYCLSLSVTPSVF